MVERSSPRPERPFSRGRLAIGLVLVTVVGAGLVFGASKLRPAAGPGRLVVAAAGAVYVHDLAAGRAERRASLPEDAEDVVPSGGGRFVAYALRGGALWLLDLDDEARWQVSERATRVLGWTPDGRVVALEGTADRDLVVVDPEGRRTQQIAGRFEGTSVLWRDDDRFVAATPTHMVDVRIGERGLDVRALAPRARPLAVAPGGDEVLYVSEDRSPRVRIGTLQEAELTASRTVFEGRATRAAVSPQGLVAFTGRDRDGRTGTWIVQSRTAPPRRINDAQAEQLAWTPDGSALVVLSDGALVAHEVRDGRRVAIRMPGRVAAFAPVG